jgi:hypothetical protein
VTCDYDVLANGECGNRVSVEQPNFQTRYVMVRLDMDECYKI